jgi:hypothetical protein
MAIPIFLIVLMLAAVPAHAQMDFSGEWDRVDNNEGQAALGDYMGIPMSDAAIAKASSWSASSLSLPEWQCRPHGGAYIKRGPSNLRLWKEVDPASRNIIAWHAEWLRSVETPIYMDGRPHPPENAAHTWAGFSTGEYVGDMLKITTTHLKEGYLRRNGVPYSDEARVIEYITRPEGGDVLTWVIIVHDPVYLTEPFIRSSEYRRAPNQMIPPYPCVVADESNLAPGRVPHYLPGENPGLTEFLKKYGIPEQAQNDGAETLYPEYQSKLKQMK